MTMYLRFQHKGNKYSDKFFSILDHTHEGIINAVEIYKEDGKIEVLHCAKQSLTHYTYEAHENKRIEGQSCVITINKTEYPFKLIEKIVEEYAYPNIESLSKQNKLVTIKLNTGDTFEVSNEFHDYRDYKESMDNDINEFLRALKRNL